ncbi:MAG: hypothetical protein DHS20C05_18750 [Hyphococcus sp.]|nr:MAG: hypothetical protein DHS20C05_18750 [Marinicaulis sp.]
MMKKRWKFTKVLLSASVVALAAVGTSAPAMAQQCASERESSPTLSPRIGKRIQDLYTLSEEEKYQEALAGYNQLISQQGDSLSAYEKSTIYELRGSIRANSEDYRGALRDFEVAVNTNGLPVSRNNQLRFFIAQLYFQLEDFDSAIKGLNGWISNSLACGEVVDSDAYFLLAAAYIQKSPPNYRLAMDPAEKAKATAPAPKKTHYDVLNQVYNELKEETKRGALLEQMVNYWPSEKQYWVQLSGLYETTGKSQEAFSVLEVAYRAGLLTTEGELKSLVQYYSYFDNPYRAAKMLEREMAAENIERTQDNLILLSQLWSQAREHKKSIPILREAANNAPNGELSYRLGMVLLADEQYRASQTALERALNKGGMDSKDTGDAWLLLGTARFSQAGPEDVAIWRNARKAFVNAQRYPTARNRATGWITYIDAVIDTYVRGIELERRQKLQICLDKLGRIERDQRIRDLQNREATPEERAAEAAVQAECGEDALAAEEASEGAAEGATEDGADEATEETAEATE